MTSVGVMASGVVPTPSFVTFLGSAANITSGTSLVITLAAPIAVGDLIIIRTATDNLDASSPTISAIDSGGTNSYGQRALRGQNATAAAGVVGMIIASKATNPLAAGGTITLTLSSAVVAKAAYAESYKGFLNLPRLPAVVASGASAAPTVTSGSANAGDLVIASVAVESRAAVTYDSDVVGGAWSTGFQVLSAATGTDAARVEVNGQYKLATATGTQTYNLTTANTDWAAMIIAFQPG